MNGERKTERQMEKRIDNTTKTPQTMSRPTLKKNLAFLNMPIVESVSIVNYKLKIQINYRKKNIQIEI